MMRVTMDRMFRSSMDEAMRKFDEEMEDLLDELLSIQSVVEILLGTEILRSEILGGIKNDGMSNSSWVF